MMCAFASALDAIPLALAIFHLSKPDVKKHKGQHSNFNLFLRMHKLASIT
jgi:hypothetical protein